LTLLSVGISCTVFITLGMKKVLPPFTSAEFGIQWDAAMVQRWICGMYGRA